MTPTRLGQQMGLPNGTEADHERVGCLQLLSPHLSPKRSLRRTLRLMRAKTKGISGSPLMEVNPGKISMVLEEPLCLTFLFIRLDLTLTLSITFMWGQTSGFMCLWTEVPLGTWRIAASPTSSFSS